MKGALEFWAFFLRLLFSAIALGAVILGPGMLLGQLTGNVWLMASVIAVSFVAFITWTTWSTHER
jgi:hypothetical protein